MVAFLAQTILLGKLSSHCHCILYIENIGVVVIYQRDGLVVRASASQSVDLVFISLVESLVVSFGKALNGTPHLCVADRGHRNGNSQASADIPTKT